MLGWGSPSLKIWMPRTHITGEGSRLGHALKQYPIDLLEQGFYELMPLSPPSFQWGEASSWCYFTSQWAVVFWARYLECIHATESMTGRRIACVGDATAATVLQVFQRPANFMPPHAQDAQHFSEAFHQAFPLPQQGIWPCSAWARATLQDVLTAQGHQIQALPCYVPQVLKPSAFSQRLAEAVEFTPDVVILTSPRNVEHLYQAGAFEQIRPKLWIGLGPSTGQALENCKPLLPFVVLKQPTAPAIWQACQAHLNIT